MTDRRSALYLGKVMHCRFAPMRHRFRYRVASLLLDLDELPALDSAMRLFSVDRGNLFSFHQRDHGPGDGAPLKPWVEAVFAEQGCAIPGGRVLCFCIPRTLGYAFNPLTVYWGYRADGSLAGVLYEVKNTFGDQHCYFIPAAPDHVPGEPLVQEARKVFHVSPFFDLAGSYRFRTDEPSETLRLLIRLVGPDGADRMIATHAAERRTLTDRTLTATLFSHPLNTFKVIAAILWEAGRLRLKKAKFHPRPEPPQAPVSRGQSHDSPTHPAKAA
ncbi:DUF1365 domain-containing protein [Thalassobaculum sp. OXR-137]|uniref:DUF1365 domain-containing protein n=1 Tax=Thalassobaculum sp. OXR-137 TaxID=3100173 RepID=UPI002AC9BF2D|nr:DUF1365 domain-containing protein [Thalassobaculum sp. OXR-137]WPZ36880.1 DUF1365 domain-containing protein [Thalassobaculum sp. OXR-137]